MTQLLRINPTQIKGRRTLQQRMGDLHQFLDFLRKTNEASEAETWLSTRRNARFIHLIDFQELFDRIAPYMEHPLKHTPILARHFTSRRFFDELEEEFTLPLGTLAELSNMLRHIRRNVRHLMEVALTRDSDRALRSFVRYFRTEGFLEEGRILDWASESNTVSEQGEPFALQRKASQILVNYERGLTALLSILKSNLLIDLHDLPTDLHATQFQEQYREVYGVLTGEGPQTRKRFGNQADAFNLSLTATLNRALLTRSTTPPIALKLVTDTNTLLDLPRNSSLTLAFTLRNFDGTGRNVEILDPYEVVILKRFSRRYIEHHGFEKFQEFSELTERASRSARRLEDAFFSPDQEVDPQEYISSLLMPGNKRDRARLRQIHKYIEHLHTFFLQEREISGSFRLREERQQLMPFPSGFAPATFAAESISSIDKLIRSIYAVIQKNDPIGSKQSPFQLGDETRDWNPLLSLERLGYRAALGPTEEAPNLLVEISEGFEGASIFRMERSTGLFISTWPTTLPLTQCLDTIAQEDLFRLPALSQLTVRASSIFGEELYTSCPSSDLGNILTNLLNPTFIRIEGEGFAFIIELFSTNEGFDLRSGLMTKTLDIELNKRLFFALGSEDYNYLFRSLVSNHLNSLKREFR